MHERLKLAKKGSVMPFVDRADVRLYYDVTDLRPPWVKDAQTIVFHHGICATLDLWNSWMPALVERYRVVRFDMRGYGRSSTEGDFSANLDDLVADLLAVVDEADAPEFHLVGESLGGTLGMVFALAYPERVKSLTITNAAAHGGRVDNLTVWRDFIDKHGQSAWAKQMMDWRVFPGALDQPRWQWFFEQHATSPVEVTLTLADLLRDADIRGELPRLRMPMLIISPDSSPFIPVGLMAEIHKSVPQSEMVVVPHTKHGLPLSHGAFCAMTLREFLARRTSSAP